MKCGSKVLMQNVPWNDRMQPDVLALIQGRKGTATNFLHSGISGFSFFYV